jgi:para-nitrobenzyl esterase
MSMIARLCVFAFCVAATAMCAQEPTPVQVKIANGVLEGLISADGLVRSFKGIPYAAPPVGALRWKPPQLPSSWEGVRRAVDFGPRAMQGRIWDDMIFHDSGPSEDCLYLNVWIPEKEPKGKLPVMVWIHGGGFAAGATSEQRQDGGNLCKHGVIVVSMNYRLGVFGFLAHPELTAESPQHASGNYGLLDLVAALKWVKDNIAVFGGDPHNVTIFGESAGSEAVSALVASPLAKGLFHRAIGESGSLLGPLWSAQNRETAETEGSRFARKAFGTSSLAVLRAKPAAEILKAALAVPRHTFPAIFDGYFLPESCNEIYAAGHQSHVPLLAGWNVDEGSWEEFFNGNSPTLPNYLVRARQHFENKTDAFLKAYAAKTDAEVKRVARDYQTDQFMGYCTWLWIDLHRRTGKSPVYRYLFAQPLPLAKDAPVGAEPHTPHASDIEYVFQMLSAKDLPWREDDHAVAEMMAKYWTNFAKTGNPNGPGLPRWPEYQKRDGYQVMRLDAHATAAPEQNRARYEFMDEIHRKR